MKIPIRSVAELGLLVRATRRAHGLRLDDVAGSAKLGAVFVGDVEHGKQTVQLGRVLQLLDELGIRLTADASDAVVTAYESLQQQGIKPRKPRKTNPADQAMRLNRPNQTYPRPEAHPVYVQQENSAVKPFLSPEDGDNV
jgi:transcriptional regulator with XRE-family HTH domain